MNKSISFSLLIASVLLMTPPIIYIASSSLWDILSAGLWLDVLVGAMILGFAASLVGTGFGIRELSRKPSFLSWIGLCGNAAICLMSLYSQLVP